MRYGRTFATGEYKQTDITKDADRRLIGHIFVKTQVFINSLIIQPFNPSVNTLMYKHSCYYDLLVELPKKNIPLLDLHYRGIRILIVSVKMDLNRKLNGYNSS